LPVDQALIQDGGRLRFGWGLGGALALTEHDQTRCLVVVIDVMSFCTTVSVAADLAIEVYPCRWRDSQAERYATELAAVLARGRRQGGISLSPASLRAAPGVARLVLPSPNGASISFALHERGSRVVAGCLRNRSAVGGWLARQLAEDPAINVVVIAAGEQWPGGALRPAVEDLWGAGAVLEAVGQQFSASPEAASAMTAYAAVAVELSASMRACSSGLELAGCGFAEDVEIAAELDQSTIVPLLTDGKFTAA
jgi:2-phosphosulfolactate phosphatase